jgi:uncharacterized protein (TIGR04255 family)
MSGYPDYERPPVYEVVVGLQFARLAGFRAPHFGLYWERVQSDFPTVQDQLPLERVTEPETPTYGPPVPGLRFVTGVTLPRVWFVSADGGTVLQVQSDRFLRNWRKVAATDTYPRFDAVREGFFREWQRFCGFLDDAGLDGPRVDQCELTYVNLLPQGEDWTSFGGLDAVFSFVSGRTRGGFLPPPEYVDWKLRFPLPDGSGRLHCEMTPVQLAPDGPVHLRVAMTARGFPSGGAADLPAWFESAREWVVRGFADLMAESTDTVWGKKA